MNQENTPKQSMKSTTSALFAQGALYGQLAWLELKVERDRLLQLLLTLLAGFSLLTSLLVSVTTFVLVASWDTPWRSWVLGAAGAFYCIGFIIIWRQFAILARQSNEAFADTREELSIDMELIRSRLDQ
jgi:uncharacterized membrane protein YqjE